MTRPWIHVRWRWWRYRLRSWWRSVRRDLRRTRRIMSGRP